MPLLTFKSTGANAWRIRSTEEGHTIEPTTVIANAPGDGTVQLWNVTGAPVSVAITIGTIADSYFEASHAALADGNYQIRLAVIETQLAVPFDDQIFYFSYVGGSLQTHTPFVVQASP